MSFITLTILILLCASESQHKVHMRSFCQQKVGGSRTDTRHKIGHFDEVPQANLLPWYGKTKPYTTRPHIHQSKEMHNKTK